VKETRIRKETKGYRIQAGETFHKRASRISGNIQ
jgi:hypothetical protein